jgi:inner membrane protein involved in colicin E2 resistance
MLTIFPYHLQYCNCVTDPCLHVALNDRLRDEVQQLKIATGQVNNANSGKMGKFGMSSYGVDSESYQRSQMQSLVAAQQLQQLQIRSQHQQPQMHLQQQHLGTVRQQHQHQLRQEALPFPGDLKMKGIAMTSHVQNAGAFGGHARNEP